MGTFRGLYFCGVMVPTNIAKIFPPWIFMFTVSHAHSCTVHLDVVHSLNLNYKNKSTFLPLIYNIRILHLTVALSHMCVTHHCTHACRQALSPFVMTISCYFFRAKPSNRCRMDCNWQGYCCSNLGSFSLNVWQCGGELQCEVPTDRHQCFQQLYYCIHNHNQCCVTRFSTWCRVHCVSGCHQLTGRHECILAERHECILYYSSG